jgi:putative heme-binding domain-containing protein
VLFFRLAKAGPGHMPQLGARLVDERGLALVHDWIGALPGRAADSSGLKQLVQLDEQAAAAAELIEGLLAKPSEALALAQAVREGRLSSANRQLAIDTALRHTDLAIRDLFEPFVPDELRSQRLGETVRSEEILPLAGDVERGRRLFHESSTVQCRNCHRIDGKGIDLGPDLSKIGQKNDRAKLLDSILEPSATIDPKYAAWLVETKAGQVYTGLLLQKDEAAITLKDAQNKEHRIDSTEIEGLYPQRKSLMPDLLLRDFTLEQVADLLAYLAALK